MAHIGLIDVDNFGKKKIRFPNLAIMKISAWHKLQGDDVEFWWSDLIHYDKVYMSKVFSDDYTKPMPEPLNTDEIIKGGTGYCIKNINGREVFDKRFNNCLPDYIEHIMPDYGLYGITETAYGFMSRGCPRGCGFCHVKDKEGLISHKVADLTEFWSGQPNVEICDPNTLACREWKSILQQLADSQANISFNQGVDIRLMNDERAEMLNKIKLKKLHFAWDNPDDDLENKFRTFAEARGINLSRHGGNGTVYCLTNYGEYTPAQHLERAIYRIETLKKYDYKPYIMIYNKPAASSQLIRLQRWVNNPFVFYSCSTFDEYKRKEE